MYLYCDSDDDFRMQLLRYLCLLLGMLRRFHNAHFIWNPNHITFSFNQSADAMKEGKTHSPIGRKIYHLLVANVADTL